MIYDIYIYDILFGGYFYSYFCLNKLFLGGGFKYLFIFTPILGEDEANLTIIFFRWVETTTEMIYDMLFEFFWGGGIFFSVCFLPKYFRTRCYSILLFFL